MTLAEFATKHSLAIIESKSVSLQPGEKGFRYSVTLQLAGKGSFVTIPYFCGTTSYIGRCKNIPNGVDEFNNPLWVKKWTMLTHDEFNRYERNKSSFSTVWPIPPQLEDVLNCLLVDFSLLNSAPFWPEYAFELGLNEDSIKERTKYDESVKQFIAFRKMLSYSLTSEFLSCDGL